MNGVVVKGERHVIIGVFDVDGFDVAFAGVALGDDTRGIVALSVAVG